VPSDDEELDMTGDEMARARISDRVREAEIARRTAASTRRRTIAGALASLGRRSPRARGTVVEPRTIAT
jgi:hypothetical protein